MPLSVDHEDEEEFENEIDAAIAAESINKSAKKPKSRKRPKPVIDEDEESEVMCWTVEDVEREFREAGEDPDLVELESLSEASSSSSVMRHRLHDEDWGEVDDGEEGGGQCFIVQDGGSGVPLIVPWAKAFKGVDFDALEAENMNPLPPKPRSNKRSDRASSLKPDVVVGKSIGGEEMRASALTILDERDIVEHFTKGGGKGGQKVNKSNNCVHLLHEPTGTAVKCHATRSLAENRTLARKILQSKLDDLLNGPKSKSAVRTKRVQKSKAKTRKRAAEKYGHVKEDGAEEDGVAEEEEVFVPVKTPSESVEQSAVSKVLANEQK